ncbi:MULTISPECIES: hypothetical protein [unclassified Modicisalibacter]|uniref:hypothetical protein n=1 Tax=unclassified Modicisalibacter TaxID=2679913 RepID=UPI001CCFC339|nr:MULTISPECIES: hypothetical protein [unclassified Modicisalibacter]MBZ9557702.1 hypothetical protein [Modicisalibacter sp. R2A 31.J]MBZ9573634.1 hypothetical protein [Modicisalibacter sp. MOD 31.J]
MRDLYKRLGVPADADSRTIDAAIEACRHTALKHDAEAVLGVDARRDHYDRLHRRLSDIGRLRSRLGLTHAPHWQGDVANDFSLPPDIADSRHQQLTAKVDALVNAQTTLTRWRYRLMWLIPLLVVVTAGVAFALGWLSGL